MNSQQSTPTFSKSQLFTQFNRARARSAGLDRQRVNRALGYIQAGRATLLADGTAVIRGNGETYYVNAEGCECADHTFRGKVCKHQIARWLMLRVAQATLSPTPLPTLEPIPTDEELDSLIEEMFGPQAVAA
jgi:hypothetical protein